MAYLHVLYVFTYGYDLTRFGIDKSQCTFEKTKQILLEYNNAVEESIVDNTIPYDHETIYEGQALHDLTHNTDDSYDPVTHIDPYGYRRNQYYLYDQDHQYEELAHPDNQEPEVTNDDMAFFYHCNGLY